MADTLFRAVCICALLSLACSVLPVRSQSQSITVTGNDQQVIGGVLSPAPLPATCACTDNTCKPQTVRTSEDIFVAGRPAACDPTTNGMFTLSGLEVRSVSGQNWASTFDKYTATFWSETAQRVRTVYATQTAVDGCLRQSSAPITATVVGVTITCTNSVTSCVLWTNKATNGVIVCKAGTPTPPPTALQAPKPTETTAVVSRTTAANNLEPMAEPTSECCLRVQACDLWAPVACSCMPLLLHACVIPCCALSPCTFSARPLHVLVQV